MKHPTECTDEMLKAAILGDEAQRTAAFTCLYEKSGWREWVIAHVRTDGGDKQRADDVFQESVILFDRNIRRGVFRDGSTLQTYFYGIAKQVWFNEKRKKKPSPEQIPEQPDPASDIEKMFLDEERRRIIYEIINQMDETCRKLLPMYMLSFSNEEIAKELGLSSAELAKKYAYRCREKFKEFLRRRGGLQ